MEIYISKSHSKGRTIGVACDKHGYVRGERCVECDKERTNKRVDVPNIEIFKPMVYEDICETPILIESKSQLREECKKHGVRACRLM